METDRFSQARAIAEDGLRLAQAGRWHPAEARLGEAVRLTPGVPELHVNLGIVLMRGGRPEAAEEAFLHALALRPDFLSALENLAMFYLGADRPAEAADRFAEALAVAPDGLNTAALLNNRGLALRRLHRDDEAEACFRQAIACPAGLADAIKNLGITLTETGRLDEAFTVLDLGLAAAPTSADLYQQQAAALKEYGRIDEAAAALDTARRLTPGSFAILQSRLAVEHYRPGVTAAALAERHAAAETLLGASRRAVWYPHANDRASDRPLRVGYVSGDLRRHPVGFFMAAVIPHHDPARVQAYGYFNHIHEDNLTAAIKAGCRRWRPVVRLADSVMADLIRADRIDILVDLSGHTAYDRLGVFALKPAPVQATWAGYTGTTGLRAIDWLIADRHHVPEGEDGHYVERIARLPEGYVAFAPPEDAPVVGPLPALEWGVVTFGCCNNMAKVSPAVIAAWGRVLTRVPGSRLLMRTKALGDPGVRRHVLSLLDQAGVTAERVTLLGEASHRELLETYNAIDIALDPFPYSGGVTTLEALWMGVPVVTVPGQTFAGRHSTSHLRVAGHGNLVARDLDHYVDLAVGLAGDREALATLRGHLRADMQRSPLLDHRRFATDLEDLFRMMWRLGNTASNGPR